MSIKIKFPKLDFRCYLSKTYFDNFMSYCVIYFIVVNLSLFHCLMVLIFNVLKQVFKNQLL